MRTRRSLALVLISAALAVAVVVAVAGWRSDRQGTDVAAPPGESLTAVDVGAGVPPAAGSDAAAIPDRDPAAADEALLTTPGRVVARGDNLVIEEVPLAAPATVEVNGEVREAQTVLRLTISAGPYVVRNAPAVISLDDRPLGVAIESFDLSSLLLLTFDESVLTQGSTLALSYGLPGAAAVEWSSDVMPVDEVDPAANGTADE